MKQRVASWRASGLTRQQYCELNAIPFTSFREWPQNVAKAERRAGGLLGKRIYGHSRFCNTYFDDKLACLNLSGV
ncbi:hypothetical protein D8R48_22740 [Salmonella enterica subsp. enterica serovar Newport]|nr:hypothetical protein [Salmonella enterica subsp. enterica serovar Newport]EAB9314424.1 hypothetical protein [Salmonella enterica subsp. enterica serovar Typhimurium]EAP1716797.1 hypothetical protein [Salmonella enterica]ECA1879200.1 hypothetical protein [Salmonella enterica subsp. enterica serovar Napoli]EDV5409631.1 hypothetical protein [Salmonella enterica subsp. enterica]